MCNCISFSLPSGKRILYGTNHMFGPKLFVGWPKADDLQPRQIILDAFVTKHRTSHCMIQSSELENEQLT